MPGLRNWQRIEPVGLDTRINKLTAQSNPLMQAAKAEGMQFANRRGLLNSSLSSQAAQKAVIDTALPIASQESSQEQARILQGREQQFAGTQAHKERAQAAMLQRRGLAATDRISRLDRAAQERIANMNVKADQQRQAAALAASIEQSYAQMFSNIAANANLPADVRESYLTAAASQRDSGLRMLEQLYGIDLDWGAVAAPTGGGGGGGGTGGGGTGGGGGGGGGGGRGRGGGRPNPYGFPDAWV